MKGSDLEDGGLQVLDVLQLLGHAGLRQLHQKAQEVGQAVAGDGGGGHHADVRPRVGVLPVQGRVQTLQRRPFVASGVSFTRVVLIGVIWCQFVITRDNLKPVRGARIDKFV